MFKQFWMKKDKFEPVYLLTQNICITFIQSWPNVFEVGQTVYEFYTNVFLFTGVLVWRITR